MLNAEAEPEYAASSNLAIAMTDEQGAVAAVSNESGQLAGDDDVISGSQQKRTLTTKVRIT